VLCDHILPVPAVGLTVETVEKGINGCIVKTISPLGAVAKDGRIRVNDYIVFVNNETLRRITNSQARAILRRAQLLGTDIR
jgi:C-terminal processing protease CtpA/Prc